MFYYELNGKLLVSLKNEYPSLPRISADYAAGLTGDVYLLTNMDPKSARKVFCVSDPSLAFIEEEGPWLVRKCDSKSTELPEWLISRIHEGRVSSVNTAYPRWQDALGGSMPQKWRINVAGLGDVGTMLVTGLRLLGGECILSIGVYDRDKNKVDRMVFEANQIMAPSSLFSYPSVNSIGEEDIFNCDMFIFCISSGVPPLGSEGGDIRMAQLEGNSRIMSSYAGNAREKGFKGIFSVVSDPVDLLCKKAFTVSNADDNGRLDFKGLSPERIMGFGLGVMNARAAFYAGQSNETSHYSREGRAYGPHGRGLIIADSILNYNDELSLYLTEKAQKANLEVRSTGFKPFIAPALSSGSLSIIAAINGEWHYSASFMGGVFMGCRNRLRRAGVEIEALDMPEPLWQRILKTYRELEGIS
jgi:malate/lactate dehydrogenase